LLGEAMSRSGDEDDATLRFDANPRPTTVKRVPR
jgi:hypothetical protein